MPLISRAGNDTRPLFSIDDKRRHRMAVDYEENTVMFKDKPDEWHTLPATKKGAHADSTDEGGTRAPHGPSHTTSA